MNKKILNIFIYGVVVCVVTFFALNNTEHDEQNVVLSLIKHLKGDNDISPSAIYSYPSNCHMDENYNNKYAKDLWSNFSIVNAYKNGPIQIFSLKGVANTVKWEDNLQIYDTKEGAIRFRPTDKVLIKLSRVGFNQDKSEALICIEPGGMGILFHLRRQNDKWEVIAKDNVWVS